MAASLVVLPMRLVHASIQVLLLAKTFILMAQWQCLLPLLKLVLSGVGVAILWLLLRQLWQLIWLLLPKLARLLLQIWVMLLMQLLVLTELRVLLRIWVCLLRLLLPKSIGVLLSIWVRLLSIWVRLLSIWVRLLCMVAMLERWMLRLLPELRLITVLERAMLMHAWLLLVE